MVTVGVALLFLLNISFFISFFYLFLYYMQFVCVGVSFCATFSTDTVGWAAGRASSP